MKNLLMATDLSARSDRALERAVKVACELNAKLTVFHVVDNDLPAALADAQETAAKQAIHQHVEMLIAGIGAKVSIEVGFGRAYVEILEMSEKTESELIILGMHRENSFKDMFYGTTVERIVRAASVPVLLVKDRINGPYQQVVVGVDFSVCSKRALEFVVKFVPTGNFHLVHAYHVPFKGLLYGHNVQREVGDQHQMQFQKMIDGEMSSFLGSLEFSPPKLKSVILEGSARTVIHKQIGLIRPELVVVGTHGRTGVAHAFVGSVAEDLFVDPPCDVLAVKAW